MPGFGRGPQVDLAARVIKKPFVAVQVSNYPLRPSRALAGAGKAKCTSRSGSPAAAEERACDNEPCDLPVFERTRSHSASPPRQQRARLLPRVSLAARSSTSSLGHHRRRHHSELDSIESGGREGSEESEKLLASTVPGKAAQWVEGQPWVPVGSTVGPRFLAGNRGSPQKIRLRWVPVALW
jgi:hypothetical protein